MDAAPSYRERLVPPWWMPLVLLLIVPATLLVFLPVDIVIGALVAAALYLAAVGALWFAAPVVALHDGVLRAGPAQIGVDHLGQADALLGNEAKVALRAQWDPADHHVVSPWVRTLVRVPVIDEEDPTPAWVISTRRPEALASAISAAQRRA